MSLPVKVDGSGNPVLDSTCKYSDDGFIPDFEYMQERITELEQYLITTGLNDYELTDEDKEILATKLTDEGGITKLDIWKYLLERSLYRRGI